MISKIQSFSRYIKIAVFCIILITGLVTSANAQQNIPSTQLISTPFPSINAPNRIIGGRGPVTSPDANFIAYESNGRIFLRDRNAQSPVPVSVSFDTQTVFDVLGASTSPSVSNGGSRIAFQSNGTNLIDPTTFFSGGLFNIYVRDNNAGTRAISVPLDITVPPNGESFSPSITPDGNFVVFASRATNLVNETINFTPGLSRIYLANLQNNPPQITLISSIDSFADAINPAISADSNKVVFESGSQIFLAQGGTITLISTADTQPAQFPTISANGSVVAFQSRRNNGSIIILDGSATIRQLPTGGVVDNPGFKTLGPSLNQDGTICAFSSGVDFSDPNNTNVGLGFLGVYTFNRNDGSFDLISLPDSNLGTTSFTSGGSPSIDGSGQFVAFDSNQVLTTDDRDAFSFTNSYLRDRGSILGGGGNGGGTGSLSLIPSCPVNATAVGSRQIDVTWGAGQHNQFLEGHKLQLYRTDPNGKTVELTTVQADAVTLYSDKTVQPKTKYSYRAWIINQKGIATAVDVTVKTKKEKK